MILFTSCFTKTKEYEKLAHALSEPGACALFGLPGSGRALVYAALCRTLERPLCIVTPGEAEATRFAGDLNTLGIPAAVFPARDYVLRPIEGTAREYEYRRLGVLGDLVGGRLQAVCVSEEALTQYTTPKADFCANTRTLRPGDSLPRTELTSLLHGAGYTRRTQVDGPGQFSIRGDIVDLYAPDMKLPVRMEFWGDEIDTMHTFDLTTQRREDPVEKIYVSPAREVLFGAPADAAALLRAFLKKQRGQKRTALEVCMAPELAQLDGGAVPVNLDKYLAVRYPEPATLLDYFDDPLLILEEPASLREAQRATAYRRGEEITTLLNDGVLAAGLEKLYADAAWLWTQPARCRTICAENFARSMPDIALKEIVNAPAHSLPAWAGEVAHLLEDLQPLCDGGASVTVLAGTPRAAAGLAADLRVKGLNVTTDETAAPSAGLVQVLPGQLSAGCSLPFAKYAVFTARAFGVSTAQKKKKRNKDALNSLSEISPGDLVVHQNHGIGRYAGIQRMAVQGVTKDYLRIEYDKKDVLYVPVTQLDLLSRYTAPGDKDNVKLSRLGGSDWAKTRKKVRAATEAMAKELIELYARRKQAKGYAFPADDTWQGDFEQRFAYEETPDQLTCAADIKHDMEQPWPMDRLLCGDVGVGKTEVALRAAFKCVMGGKQCAILAPTTILAWQHFNTAIARMEAYPIRIGLLSRYRSSKEQKETLRGLKDGTVDIVVGTHRLLSDDVKFRDLGLVIIDEEQRFGVKHKEKLKEAFIGVDMLTLSATPIPRTLNMALSGIRDMSTIEQPPFERQPVETYVLEYDEGIVSEAIRKELARGGQVYYLHNRVDTINECAARIGKMVPGARVGIAHGKMTEEQISSVWQQLLDNEIDVLVCTTLIETGVDVRNCNTLIIENADRMGLSQLYQLRGRVGRSSRKAYAYFTFTRDKVLTEVAAKRLSAIREFTAFGSGFRIAMRDLQIRGAGSLLGHSQHGHMEAVGYDLYVKMLGQAIATARGETPPPDKSDCLVDISIDAYLPEDYIPDPAGRIEAYKRIAAIETTADAEDVLDELIDRYGSPPKSVQGLVDVSLVRVTAARVGIVEIVQRNDLLILYSDVVGPQQLAAVMEQYPHRVLYNALGRPYFSLRVQKGENPLVLLRDVVTLLPGATPTAS
ncbi:transcription-repair coupling factor [Subdoligranulum variabile]|uniref:Transcription-repair-coupling factor n=1 Tax=Subdoligranulum variabile DSM 15176 TaxID=411471 RepID=D1PN58_9FIRM|nr:transcription-repair coupling factor [Subdoligranulum variabile]EFB75993.1 transcription-repair coupling factor [Subdoligranulum variabile DSM 15176]UWP68650.1 transcription-repair coupling factor [Subdoligranulum variabile]